MKKHLLALAILGSGLASAQAWSENFSSAVPNALPVGWLQNNVDGLTVATNINTTWNFGTNAWVSWNYTGDPHGKVAASTSWYASPGISNDWLITPAFTVPANSVLEFEATAVEAGFQDGFQVKISTTGTAVADFNANPTLLSVAQENVAWTNRSAALNTYAGQTVRLAFVNNSNDKNRLYMDNFAVLVPASNDGNVVSVTSLTRYMAGAGLQTIGGVFKSKGFTPANNAELNYSVNNGAAVTQVFTFGTPLNYGQTANYAFTTQANLPVGTNKIKVWVTKVNTTNETNLLNDTAYAQVYVSSQSATRSILIEEWTSSTCNPCASLNSSFDPLLNSNNPNTGGDVNVVKYQVNWPSPGNDPSYNAHVLARRTHYGVNAAPTSIIDGKTEMNAHSQAEIDAAKLEPAFADITATVSAKGSTLASAATSVVASATIMPYLTIPANSPLRLYQAIVQYSYTYAASSTTQDAYYHVMRKMNPDGWGTPLNVTSGTPIVVNFSLNTNAGSLDPSTPVQNSYSVWVNAAVGPKAPRNIVYEYVVFVQDTISNDVIQSGSWTSTVSVPAPPTPTSTVGMDELSATNQISVFPNPAKEFAIISINVEKSALVDVTIYDVTGKIVYANKGSNVDAGKNEMRINTSELASGNYNIVVNANGAVLKEKLVVVK
jgi:hypothetical protein